MNQIKKLIIVKNFLKTLVTFNKLHTHTHTNRYAKVKQTQYLVPLSSLHKQTCVKIFSDTAHSHILPYMSP